MESIKEEEERTYKVPEHVDKEHCHSGLLLHEAESQVAPTSARPPNSSANTNAHQKGATNRVSMGANRNEKKADRDKSTCKNNNALAS